MEDSNGNSSKSGMVTTNQRKAFEGIQMENPFSFIVLQVFTGFGIGCGVGIGVGRPVNLGLFNSRKGKNHREFLANKPRALPMVGEVMSATRGATVAFSGVSRHVNNALRKFGAKNIEAGIGCGVGFGYGFGAASNGEIDDEVRNRSQSIHRSRFPPMSLQSGMGMINQPSSQNPVGNMMQLTTKMPGSQVLPDYVNINIGAKHEKPAYKSTPDDTSFGRTEKVLSNFLQNPVLREEGIDLNEVLMKHQRIIEDLMEENEQLRQILVEDLKVPTSKLQASYSSKPPCTDCFERRRKQRKK